MFTFVKNKAVVTLFIFLSLLPVNIQNNLCYLYSIILVCILLFICQIVRFIFVYNQQSLIIYDLYFFSEMEITNAQKLGVGFGSFGVFFIFLGVLLLFDKGMFAYIKPHVVTYFIIKK